MVTKYGYLKLVDFGTAKFLNHTTTTSTMIGTPQYMAPEMIMGRPYTSAVDVWAMGIMCYEMVCGPTPFGYGVADQTQIFREIIMERPKIPDFLTHRPTVNFIKSLLRKEPHQRPSGTAGYSSLREASFWENFSFDDLVCLPIENSYTELMGTS